MAYIDQFVKLKEVIFMYSEAARKSDAEFLRLWRMAFRGMVQMGLNSFWQPRTVALPVNDNKTVVFPKDYIQWLRVGQIMGNEIITLKNNQSLYSATGNFAGAADIIGTDVWFKGYVPVGISTGCRNIDFKVEKNHIVLNLSFEGSSILLEYLCSPESDDEFTIPLQFQEAMIAWMGWQDINYLPATSHIGNNNVEMQKANFRAQVKLARKMYKPWRISEVEGGEAEFNLSEIPGATDAIEIPTKNTFTVEWDYVEGPISDPFTQSLGRVAEFTFGQPIQLNLGASPTRASFLEVRYPVTESRKTTWFNTSLNSGTLPDRCFMPVAHDEKHRCIVARVPRLEFDITTPTIFS